MNACALLIDTLVCEAGIQPQDAAVTVAGLSGNEDMVRRGFSAYHLSVDVHSGKKLSEYPAGRFFTAIHETAQSRFSFASLKYLLLSKTFPWKNGSLIAKLLDFGLRHCCIRGFEKGDGYEEIWASTFDHLEEELTDYSVGYKKDVHNFYNDLKNNINAIVEAKTFNGLEKAVHKFEDKYFETDKITHDVDEVFSRIMALMHDLSLLEEKLDFKTENVFSVFLACMAQTSYLAQSGKNNIQVYDYKVQALTMPLVHFILNLNEDDGNVTLNTFLREDRKSLLAMPDINISEEYLAAYMVSGVFCVFSSCKNGKNGYAAPLSGIRKFMESREVKAVQTRATASAVSPKEKDAETILSVVKKQKTEKSFELDAKNKTQSQTIIFKTHHEVRVETPSGFLDVVNGLSVTSDLEKYNLCPFGWMLRKAFKVYKYETELEIEDNKEAGNIYHKALQLFFGSLKDRNEPFLFEKLDDYCTQMDNIADDVMASFSQGKNSFQNWLLKIKTPSIKECLKRCLTENAVALDNKKVIGAEYGATNLIEDDLFLFGRTDLVLCSEDGDLMLLDYKKTKGGRSIRDSYLDENGGIKDIQIPAYIMLLENELCAKVSAARYYFMEEKEKNIYDIIQDSEKKKRREDIDMEIKHVEDLAAKAVGAVRGGMFPAARPVNFRFACKNCDYMSVCRRHWAS
jgi:hypothetical protein